MIWSVQDFPFPPIKAKWFVTLKTAIQNSQVVVHDLEYNQHDFFYAFG